MVKSLSQQMHDRARRLAQVHPLQTVAELIGVLPSQISRMKKRGWKAPPDGAPRRPMPADFPIQSRHMSHGELTRHYRAGNTTVSRWFRELEHRRPSWRGQRHPSREGASA